MRLVATSDTHLPFEPEFVPDGDVFIHAGDLMEAGTVNEWYSRLESLRALPHKTKIYIPGNHDFYLQHFAGPALWDLKKAGVTVLGMPADKDTMTLDNGLRLLGLPMVHNLKRWAFNFDEDYLDNYMQDKKRVDIVISHCPPKGILDEQFGINAYRKYLELTEPQHWICGHIHEEGGRSVIVGRTKVHNVAAMDRNYDRVNKPLILDL